MSDVATQARIFLGVSAFMAVIGIVYWFASYEPAGTVMLALASVLTGVCGVYLLLQGERATGTGPTGTDHGGDTEYLPHSSVWPFAIGVGAWLTASGMILSFSFAVPGLVVLAAAITGLVSQSRRRA